MCASMMHSEFASIELFTGMVTSWEVDGISNERNGFQGVHIKTDPEAILKEVNKIRQEEKEKAKQKKLLENEQDKQKENGQQTDS